MDIKFGLAETSQVCVISAGVTAKNLPTKDYTYKDYTVRNGKYF